jgi:hypothetical protein
MLAPGGIKDETLTHTIKNTLNNQLGKGTQWLAITKQLRAELEDVLAPKDGSELVEYGD